MAHRDKIGCTLRSHDARYLGYGEHIALLYLFSYNCIHHFTAYTYNALRRCCPFSDVLVGDIYHPRVPSFVKMCEITHFISPISACF